MGESEQMSAGHQGVIRSTFVVLLCATVLAALLVACGPSESESIKNTANAAIEEAVAGDPSTYEVLYGEVQFSPEPYGVSWECLSENYFTQVSQTVDKVEKTDSGYTAYVTMQTCNEEELIKDLVRASERAREDLDLSSSGSGASDGFADQAFMDLLSEEPLSLHEVPLELYFVQDEKNAWTLKNKDVLLGAALGGFDGRQEGV